MDAALAEAAAIPGITVQTPAAGGWEDRPEKFDALLNDGEGACGRILRFDPDTVPQRTGGTVLVVRDPDESNEITVDGDVHVVDVDLGRGFSSRKELRARLADDDSSAAEFLKHLQRRLRELPDGSSTHQALQSLLDDLQRED
jgi:hypothetical protein